MYSYSTFLYIQYAQLTKNHTKLRFPFVPVLLGQLWFLVTSLKLLTKFNWDTKSIDFSTKGKECFFISIQLIMCPGEMSAECTVPIQQCNSAYCVVTKIVQGELPQ